MKPKSPSVSNATAEKTMNFDLNAANIIRILFYVALSVAAFVILIRVLKFLAGVILGFAVTMFLAYLYFKTQL